MPSLAICKDIIDVKHYRFTSLCMNNCFNEHQILQQILEILIKIIYFKTLWINKIEVMSFRAEEIIINAAI